MEIIATVIGTEVPKNSEDSHQHSGKATLPLSGHSYENWI